MDKQKLADDISIVLCGVAGQGIQTVEALITKTLKRPGYHVFATREYMLYQKLQSFQPNLNMYRNSSSCTNTVKFSVS